LIVCVPLLADVGLSGIVPGANDNASGVATVLRLADRYGDDLDYFDLWVLFTGAEEALTPGMRAFLKRHKRELDRSSTIFVNLDMVGSGTVRYARKEGLVLALRYHPTLVELCQQIAAEDAEGDDRYAARAFVSRSTTDANAARAAGYPAIRISCLNELDYAPHYHQPTDTPDRIDGEALERAFRFCSELIELIDERIGPELERASDEVAVAGREDRDR
jgi:Iap family predicted aminopeptidase